MFYQFFLSIFLLFSFSHACFGATITMGEEIKKFFEYRSNPAIRVSSAPFLTSDTIRSIANWYIDETATPITTENVQAGDIIFVNRMLLEQFLEYIHPHIYVPYILLTSDSDQDSIFAEADLQALQSPNLALWASINCMTPTHPKVIPLPLGIISEACTAYGFASKKDYEEILSLKNAQKTIFCLVNFTLSSHPDRQRVVNDLRDKPYITFSEFVPPKQYLENLANSVFCICPRGAGWDCFRNWECLLLGGIPILEHSILDPLFHNLPVVLVDDFKSLTQEFLDYKEREFGAKTFDCEKIYADYWLSFLLSIQRKLKNSESIEEDVRKFKQKTYGI